MEPEIKALLTAASYVAAAKMSSFGYNIREDAKKVYDMMVEDIESPKEKIPG